jgi:hypothetical protein
MLLLIGCDSNVAKSTPSTVGSAWLSLISTEGCLVGSQDAIDRLREGTCLAEKPWLEYLAHPTDEKVDFLIERMASSAPTKVHTCSFGNATEGELAVYALQHLTDKLWVDYSGSNQEILSVIGNYERALDGGAFVSGQATLWEILESAPRRSALGAYFKEPLDAEQASASDGDQPPN